MRITIITDRYTPEARAAAYLSRTLAEGLVRRGHVVTVITRSPTHFLPAGEETAIRNSEVLNGVHIERVTSLSAASAIWIRAIDQAGVALRIMGKLLSAPKPDVVIVYSPPLLMTLPAIVQKWLRSVPILLNLHDLYPQAAIDLGVLRNKLVIWAARKLESLLYRSADQILVAAPSSRGILCQENNVSSAKVEVLHNYVGPEVWASVDDGSFRSRAGLNGRFVVLYAGLMGLAQDLGLVIDCAREVEHDREWTFVLVGDGPCAGKWKCAAAGLSNVRVLDPVGTSEYFQMVKAADVCLAPLVRELKSPAIPGKVQTIMACGRPIIAAVPDGNDTRALLQAGQCGLAVAAGCRTQLRQALETLYSQPGLRIEMGRNGAAYASRHFTIDCALDKCETALRAALRLDRPKHFVARQSGD